MTSQLLLIKPLSFFAAGTAPGQGVLSTSLHVKIMATIFHKPSVTWCEGHTGKHQAFIRLWDAPDAAQCVASKNDTYEVLKKYMGPAPEITQDNTKEATKKMIDLYMKSFAAWYDTIGA